MASGTRFDPRVHTRRLDNGAEYLDVKWRIAWLRADHPDAQIETELIAVDEERALCKATVRLPTGGTATAHASAMRSSGSSQVEQAESRAIGRALAALGYGTEYGEDDLVSGRSPERPVSLVPTATVRQLREPEPEEFRSSPDPAPLPRTERVDRHARPERATTLDRDETTSQTPDEPSPVRPEQTTESELTPVAPSTDEASQPTTSAADVSWTRFWEWAKDRGYRDRNHLKELLGVDVMSMSPRDVRQLIVKYELDNPPSGREE